MFMVRPISPFHRYKILRVCLLAFLLQAGFGSNLLAQPSPAPSPDGEQQRVHAEGAPPGAPIECVPGCRSGFTCVQGSCVSLCNPPCDAVHVCTAQGECIPSAPPTAVSSDSADTRETAEQPLVERSTVEQPALFEQPVVEPAEPAWMDSDPAPPEDDSDLAVKRQRGLVFVARAGVLVSGSGEGEIEIACSGSACDVIEPQSESSDLDDTSQFAVEGDVLFHVGPNLRLGFGALIVPASAVEFDDNPSETELGMEVTPIGVIEGVFGGNIAGTVRAFAGMPILFPGDDLDDLIEGFDDACDSARSDGRSCSNDAGPFLGYTLGVGGGVLGKVSEAVALRGDLVLQYQSIGFLDVEESDSTGSIEVKGKYSTTRIWLMGGLEF